MKSSTGQYFIGLDHIRALATFLVFTWHFNFLNNGQHAPPPTFPLSLLTEGHTGVALFMVLSGYLFAKLLDGKQVHYKHFLWNRFLRLAPLLFLVLVLIGLQRYLEGQDLFLYTKRILAGVIKPSLPNGAWSITVEFHFYLMLPLLLFLAKKWKFALLFFLLTATLTRIVLYRELGQIQILSYWTIIGRIDQFILGILAFQLRSHLTKQHLVAAFSLILFACFYWYFDSIGGFFKNVTYPSPNPIWIYLPTIEGLAYGLLVAWYDTSFKHVTGKISRFIALIGTYSYSIYLLHPFFVFQIAKLINDHLVDLTNIHLLLLFSPLGFLLMVPLGFISYRLIEMPFLRFRTRYIISRKPNANAAIDVRESA